MVFPGNQRMNPWPGIASSPAPHPSKAVHVEPAAPWTPCEARAAVVKLRKVQNHGVSQVSIYLYSVCVYVYIYIYILCIYIYTIKDYYRLILDYLYYILCLYIYILTIIDCCMHVTWSIRHNFATGDLALLASDLAGLPEAHPPVPAERAVWNQRDRYFWFVENED